MADEDDEPFELAPPPPQKPKPRRSWRTPLLLGAAVLVLYAGSTREPPKPTAQAPAGNPEDALREPWRTAVIKELMDGSTIQDATWAATGSLWVGVMDDGTRRDGLAQYACEVVRSHRPNHSESPIVTVLDIAKMTITKERVQLGRYHCR